MSRELTHTLLISKVPLRPINGIRECYYSARTCAFRYVVSHHAGGRAVVKSSIEKLKEDVIKLMTDLSTGGEYALATVRLDTLTAPRLDPGLLALVGNDPSLLPVLTRTWIDDGIGIGELWTATEGDELVGFMMWTPPGATAKIP